MDCIHSTPETITISIHAPREGGDLICFPQTANGLYFNPRPPRGGRHQTFEQQEFEL